MKKILIRSYSQIQSIVLFLTLFFTYSNNLKGFIPFAANWNGGLFTFCVFLPSSVTRSPSSLKTVHSREIVDDLFCNQLTKYRAFDNCHQNLHPLKISKCQSYLFYQKKNKRNPYSGLYYYFSHHKNHINLSASFFIIKQVNSRYNHGGKKRNITYSTERKGIFNTENKCNVSYEFKNVFSSSFISDDVNNHLVKQLSHNSVDPHNDNIYESPAKINLFLKILNKRADNFHELVTLIHAISLSDKLLIDELTSKFSTEYNDIMNSKGMHQNEMFDMNRYEIIKDTGDIFATDSPRIPLDQSNLIMKAINLYREFTGITSKRFLIKLKKNIPPEAGLGGGSSNAATALFAINKICGEKLNMDELIGLTQRLGSDVPVFLQHGAGLCFGRGEICYKLNTPGPLVDWLLGDLYIFKLKKGLSTPEVYKNLKIEKLKSTKSNISNLEKLENLAAKLLDKKQYPDDENNLQTEILAVILKSIESIYQQKELENKINGKEPKNLGNNTQESAIPMFINDLEVPAFELFPTLRYLKTEIEDLLDSTVCLMSGSGSAIFALKNCHRKDVIPNFFNQENRDDSNQLHHDLINNPKFESFQKKFPGLEIFKCHFVSKPADRWYSTGKFTRVGQIKN